MPGFRSLKTALLLTAAAASAPCTAFPQASGPATLADAGRILQRAFDHGDAAAMLKARGLLLGLLAAEPGSAPVHYWVAVADWRVVPLLTGKDRDAARRHCEEGLAQCAKALDLDPGFAEALAMKAGLQGMSIQFNSASGMLLGPQMQANMTRAVEMAPANPRIRLLDGINTLHMPAFIGGGAERALAKLQKAHALFEAAATDTTPSGWGRDDAFLWAGKAKMQMKDFAAARDYYLKALAANPENGWVRQTLLPEAEQAAAKKETAR